MLFIILFMITLDFDIYLSTVAVSNLRASFSEGILLSKTFSLVKLISEMIFSPFLPINTGGISVRLSGDNLLISNSKSLAACNKVGINNIRYKKFFNRNLAII